MIMDRVAGAPISWGVCEVPGWGHQLAPERVLAEMREVGLAATEFGPDGFLPADPQQKATTLGGYGLAAVGGFVPVLLHDRDHDPLPGVGRELDGFVAAGAGVLVLAAASGRHGYDSRPDLDDDAWRTLLGNLDRLADLARDRGVTAVLHPHVGTVVEGREEVERVLAGSAVPLCLDTGHLLIGGTDPVELAESVPDRVAHTHLKDVDVALAERVRAGEIGYTDAVRAGMYRPLGRGDIDLAGLVGVLEGHGYRGWYVLEQDTVLTGEPAGEGPVTDVRASVAHLRTLTG
ncbi:MAG TPA: sugar phosphate isomerase/epimerase [Pseudonocardia sp.]|nr:sugar phosphate isomerase/epimerase [Pseudonocardia sp.]